MTDMIMPLVSVYTQVYNTKPFLARCVESVLSQTFSKFEYILIDNGSTDGCKEMLEEYADQDSRIRLIRFERNRSEPLWLQEIFRSGTRAYMTTLDSDDWWEPDYLERLIGLAEKSQTDIVCTGTAFHIEGQEDAVSGVRSFPQRIGIKSAEYAKYFPYYHVFFRTHWGKLVRREILLLADTSIIDREGITNGNDTLIAFAWLRQAKRICIDSSVLHHYLVRNKSVSHVYLPNRFKSNTVLHQDAVDFLSQYGPISRENRHFLHIVYANAVSDTLEVLWSSTLSPAEKLAEYCTIALHPTTVAAYQDQDSAIERSRNILRQQLLAVAAGAETAPETLPQAVQTLCPLCGAALTGAALPLFQRERGLLAALGRDDWDALVEGLMGLIVGKRYTKQFDLGAVLRSLVPPENPLHSLTDVRFLQQYPEIGMLLLCENYPAALGEMTELLLEGRKLPESFLRLYPALASRQGEEGAFLFGMVRLARELLRQGRTEEAASIVKELEDMGIEENPELAELRRRLKEDI